MHRNNYIPTIVERSARRATRIVCNGPARLTSFKAMVHRAYRRKMKMQMHEIICGNLDSEEYDDTATGNCRCTAWDIW